MDFDKKELTTYLDGVPFVVGQKFCPPRTVALPDEALRYEPPSELLSDELDYDFAVESKVLADIEAEKEKKQQEKLEQQSAEAKALEPSPLANGTSTSVKPVSSSIPLWPAVQILQPKSKSPSKNVPTVRSENIRMINLSDFENDTPSPFDYMELQTINDMEELSTVFQGLCKTQREPASEKLPAADDKSEIASSEASQNLGNVSKSISFPLPESFDVRKSTASSGPQSTAASLSSTFSVSKSFVKNSENYLSYSYPNMPGAFSGHSGAASSVNEKVKRNSFTSNSIDQSSLALSQVPFVSSDPGRERFSAGQPRVSGHPALPLRSSKSIPDLTNLLPNDEVVPKLERSHTPPANRRVSCSLQEEQTFVKTTHLESDSPKRNVWSSNGLLTCTAVQSDRAFVEEKQHPQLPDPYDELNNSERQIVDFITDMGFHRGQVSRTVKHLGTDEKKVVEHLCQIQALEESGYDKLEAEAALHLHDYDKQEAIRYLDLLNQFQDLGFEKDAIRKALVQNKNDRDKVIDALLS